MSADNELLNQVTTAGMHSYDAYFRLLQHVESATATRFTKLNCREALEQQMHAWANSHLPKQFAPVPREFGWVIKIPGTHVLDAGGFLPNSALVGIAATMLKPEFYATFWRAMLEAEKYNFAEERLLRNFSQLRTYVDDPELLMGAADPEFKNYGFA